MKLDVITMWYNESLIAPFFLNHYSYADTIHILLDEETSDNTQKIISKFKNTHIIPTGFPDGLDDILKVKKINSLYRSIDSDWIVIVDSDEFIFSLPLTIPLKDILENESKYNLFNAHLWQVYRHRNDHDLNPDVPAVLQRRHGDPNISTGINAYYVKPIILRSGLEVKWEPGCHSLAKKNINDRIKEFISRKQILLSPYVFHGVHWSMADPTLATTRRINRKKRLSRRNLDMKLGVQNFNITEEQIYQECMQHADDPLLF